MKLVSVHIHVVYCRTLHIHTHTHTQDLPTAGRGSDNTVRRLLDGMGSVAGAVGSVSVGPTKMVGSWVADQIAPKYWVPNSKIVVYM